MIFQFKKTNEFSSQEIKEICDLFFEVFKKEKTIVEFNKQFLNTILGYSYHGLLKNDENEIVGCYTSIPVKYHYYDKELIFALSVDTMIKEEYRGNPFTLKKLSNLVYDSLKSDNVPFVFGFPNDNVYLVRQKILKWKDVGQLDYFILPINIGAIKTNFKFLNPISKLFSKILLSFIHINLIDSKKSKNIEKVTNSEFMNYRYSLLGGNYSIIDGKDNRLFDFIYKVEEYENIKTAYIIDINNLNKSRFDNAVKNIFKCEKDIDVILYVGKLDFKPKTLFKVPKKLIPKTVYMSGKVLDSSIISDDIYDIENWNVNLSNLDVV